MATETERASKHAYYLVHREQIIAHVRAYRLVHLEEIRLTKKRYRATHREEISAHHAQRYRENGESIRARIAKHRREHLAEHRERERRAAIIKNPLRRAHLLGLPDTLALSQWEAIKRAYGGRCAYCGTKPRKLTIDHVVPISKGGGTVPENIVPACSFCNTSKGAREAPNVPAIRLMF